MRSSWHSESGKLSKKNLLSFRQSIVETDSDLSVWKCVHGGDQANWINESGSQYFLPLSSCVYTQYVTLYTVTVLQCMRMTSVCKQISTGTIRKIQITK